MATLSGEIRDENNDLLADCVVRAYRRDTGALLVAGLSGDGSPEEPGDADYASVSLLLHCDGTDGSTTFTDNSPTPKTVTAYGNAHIETDQSKFGGASAYFDGAGDYLSIPNATDLTLSDATTWTIEGWMYPLDSRANSTLISKRSGSNPTSYYCGRLSGQLVFYNGTTLYTQTGTTANNSWTHFAYVFNAGNLKIFADGTKVGEWGSVALSEVNTVINIGRHYSTIEEAFNGYLDDLRITKGVACYNANFTPPTAAFLDYAVTPAKPLGEYTLTTAYTDEVQVIALDPAGGTTFNDLILRTTPV